MGRLGAIGREGNVRSSEFELPRAGGGKCGESGFSTFQ